MRRRTLLGALVPVAAGCAVSRTVPPNPTETVTVPSGSAPSSSGTAPRATGPGTTAPRPSGSSSTAPGQGSCRAVDLSLDDLVGQLFMVGFSTPQADIDVLQLINTHRPGSVILMGDRARADTTVFTSQLARTDGLPVLVAADQEGGLVQRLNGSGFTDIPSAEKQSAMTTDELRKAWQGWGREMVRAGVRYDLAPVVDVVPSSYVTTNQPVGVLHRHYGTTVDQVNEKATAVIQGLRDVGVVCSAKHFPGLGRVTTNTDFGKAVDTVTTKDDPLLGTFAHAIKAGVGSVMVANAVYRKIDPDNPAVFSRTIITDLLRGTLGFGGVVISDDMGAARAVSAWTPAQRAVKFLQAGGDIVLTVNPGVLGAMVRGVKTKAAADKEFAASLAAKAQRVLALKQAAGLSC